MERVLLLWKPSWTRGLSLPSLFLREQIRRRFFFSFGSTPSGSESDCASGDALVAPEEVLVPDPCSVTDSLSYVEQSVDEAEAEYLRDCFQRSRGNSRRPRM